MVDPAEVVDAEVVDLQQVDLQHTPAMKGWVLHPSSNVVRLLHVRSHRRSLMSNSVGMHACHGISVLGGVW